jgi:hypothetical protein
MNTFQCLNGTFSGSGSGKGIFQPGINPTNLSMNISGNTFTNSSASIGFATTIIVTSGTLCLNFTDNVANVLTPDAYQFFNSGGGTFNLTSASTPGANTGSFSIGAGVGPPGTCTLPP